MKKKLRIRKGFYRPLVAYLSLFAVCSSNLHAANNSRSENISMTETVPDFTLTAMSDESVSLIADEEIPCGVWNVTQVISEKEINGKAARNTYGNATEVQGIIPCPSRWEIMNDKQLVMHFPDGKKETLEYTLKDGQLIINYIGANFKYLYSVNNEILTLTAIFKYGDKEENLIITSKKQS